MPKRLGRPTKAPKPGTRVPLSFRVTAGVRQQLEELAIANGRSLSQEAELRLEQSFKNDVLEGKILEEHKFIMAEQKRIKAQTEEANALAEKLIARNDQIAEMYEAIKPFLEKVRAKK